MPVTFSTKLIIALILLFTGLRFPANAQTELTAEEIIDKSVEFCGGAENISKVKFSNLVYDVTMEDGSHASVIIKRELSQKYMRSILSDKHVPASMHYNSLSFTQIIGNKKITIDDPTIIEEIQLQTYNQPQYGYKELAYSLTRREDQNFNYFDCYVISATAKNGYTTLNYFDKTNFRLIMIIYPGGNKSLLMEYVFKDSVLFNTKILNVEENSEQMVLSLKKIENNKPIDPLWFSVDHSSPVPDYIKKGLFISSDGTLVNRTDSVQTEQNGDNSYTLSLRWTNNYTYAMADSKSVNKSGPGKTAVILVRVISWDKDGYTCHYYSNGVAGTQEYKIKKL